MNEYIPTLIIDWLDAGHRVLWTHEVRRLRAADFCFYISCGQIVGLNILKQYRNNLVVHESDLPQGKGWSPLTWQILEGQNFIPVTLFEAAEKVDSGVIYAQEWISFEGHELVGELRAAQAKATIGLCKKFIESYPEILSQAREQQGHETFYPRRRPTDSQLDQEKSLTEQFQLLRVVDNENYPAYFELYNRKYLLLIKKAAI